MVAPCQTCASVSYTLNDESHQSLLPFRLELSKMKDTEKTPRSRATRRMKRTDRGVAFEEMLRLMRIYGSVKCLRKRQNSDEGEMYTKTKIESVKRKFYRWFPDLDERFTRDEHGMYWPNCGHEDEIRYREEMRKKDGEIIITKRVTCRRDRHGSSERKTKKKCPNSNNDESSQIYMTATAPESDKSGTCVTHNEIPDPMASFSASVDIEPIDISFLAEHGVLDDFDTSLFGLPSAVSLSCSSSQNEQDFTISSTSSTSSSWEVDAPSFFGDNRVESVMGCDEMLSSDDGDSVSDYLLDLVSAGTDQESIDDFSSAIYDEIMCSDDSVSV